MSPKSKVTEIYTEPIIIAKNLRYNREEHIIEEKKIYIAFISTLHSKFFID